MRKGISPLIAATLLIAFTMTIALLVGPFFSNLLQDTTQGQSEEAQGLLEASQTSISIENVTYSSSTGNYTVTIRNSGQQDVNDFVITVLGPQNYQREITGSPTLSPGEVNTWPINTDSSNKEEEELEISLIDQPVKASTSLDTVTTGSSPAAPTGLDVE